MQPLVETRNKVNGKFLSDFSGKPITILGKVIKVHSNGTLFEMKSTDNQIITVILNEPLSENLEGWIEVRGNGQGRNSVICHKILNLDDICHSIGMFDVINLSHTNSVEDAELYDDLINVINSCSNPWSS
ncbi:Replication protein A 14 kDa subunit, putative [Pediculus humanus corporis]|uniref:Replication protein A 14 kDa subunit, putative n=1 Tax=Pediculus humanus subsp. corporis TaxID=121224 RepID=E0VUG4_PEDHC|nr:Replication protein A 14 kDa subunit, putative [Pediculus humanus corporis]EEB17020.1 Replication protein A 14 kDa subunit, putative [Pediculus humanus corporis]